jgi:L-asparagine transporter-like permease
MNRIETAVLVIIVLNVYIVLLASGFDLMKVSLDFINSKTEPVFGSQYSGIITMVFIITVMAFVLLRAQAGGNK